MVKTSILLLDWKRLGWIKNQLRTHYTSFLGEIKMMQNFTFQDEMMK